WCARLGLSEPDAADFTQEVFVLLVEHLPQFRYDPAQSFRAWLKTVLMNVWRKHQRKAARAPATTGDPALAADPDPCRFVDEAEPRASLVRRAVPVAQTDFDPPTWKPCGESLVNAPPAAEVAAELGIPVNAVSLAKPRVLPPPRAELPGLLD